MADDEFEAAMLERYEIWRDQIGYRATRYVQMVRRRGGWSPHISSFANKGVSQGFQSIAEAHRLDLTVEWLVLQPRCASLFRHHELKVARHGLIAHGAAAAPLPS
jgi:hypothetical protein